MDVRTRRIIPALACLLVALALALVAVACGDGGARGAGTQPTGTTTPGTTTTSTAAPVTTTPGAAHPNIVFVLTDDLSIDLLRYMPAVQAMQRQGTSFADYFVTDSLCCPSRSSIFTGDFPHDTGVFTNTGADGGIEAFLDHGNQDRAFNVYLERAGYRTGMMGKWINGYLSQRSGHDPHWVPPGWSEWDVTGNRGYNEYGYTLNENGSLRQYGHRPQDYLVDVMARKGQRFIADSARQGSPFFLELATYAPHEPATPAPRYRHAFAGVTAPEPPNYDLLPTAAPRWLAGRRAFTAGERRHIDRAFRRRVRAVQAVDDLISRVRETLQRTGQLRNTYVVFSSDNGYHTGEYRLMPGKQTAFDTDIHVPLVIDGPGVPAGATTDAMAQNVDLAPTFEQIADAEAPCDGHTLLPALHGRTTAIRPTDGGASRQIATPANWRNAVLVEHHGPDSEPGDPDRQRFTSGDPTSYSALRTPRFTYVHYRDGEHELYDLRTDPFQLHNIFGELGPAQRAALADDLARMRACHGGAACWAAQRLRSPVVSLRR